MCGLTGIWGAAGRSASELRSDVTAMAATLRLRGPDDHGSFVDPRAGFALGHRRLSVLDLTARGRQPMASACGRYQLAYNGEIYNFRELQAELEQTGSRFRTGTDTEVVLSALVHWGVPEALSRFVGMFAFALWDTSTRKLVLARDRLGVKPLYFGLHGGMLSFASELKALRARPGFEPELDRDALALYFRHGYIPAPHSIYRGVFKLQPGCWAEFAEPAEPILRSYWSAREVAQQGARRPVRGEQAEEQLLAVLQEAVGMRAVADVPVGAFLSGGVDSSLIVALMQEQSSRPVRTFTVRFAEDEFNEADHARAVARHLGTRHRELMLSQAEAQMVIPQIPEHWDEPFADSSQIPTYLVSRLAREHVTVCLSGDGGDELFGGYQRYQVGRRIGAVLDRAPHFLRRGVAGAVRSVSQEHWDRLSHAAGPLWPRQLATGGAGRRMHRMAAVLELPSADSLYLGLVSHWKEPESLVPGSHEPATVLSDPAIQREVPGFFERMMLRDTVSYLPDDILTKVDRASMAVSLEARVPLLDHRVVELAWRIPRAQRVGKGEGKRILRRILYRYVPSRMVDRPKQGFGVPIGSWLRASLRDWAEEMLSEAALARDELLDPAPIRALWRRHLAGEVQAEHYLWDVLMFQSWRQRWD